MPTPPHPGTREVRQSASRICRSGRFMIASEGTGLRTADQRLKPGSMLHHHLSERAPKIGGRAEMQRPTASGGPVRITNLVQHAACRHAISSVGAVHAGAFDRRRMLKLGGAASRRSKKLTPVHPRLCNGNFLVTPGGARHPLTLPLRRLRSSGRAPVVSGASARFGSQRVISTVRSA